MIGLSILSGAHNAIVPRVSDLLRQNKMEDVLFLIGGIIPEQDFDFLKKSGVSAYLQPRHSNGRDRRVHPQKRKTTRPDHCLNFAMSDPFDISDPFLLGEMKCSLLKMPSKNRGI